MVRWYPEAGPCCSTGHTLNSGYQQCYDRLHATFQLWINGQEVWLSVSWQSQISTLQTGHLIGFSWDSTLCLLMIHFDGSRYELHMELTTERHNFSISLKQDRSWDYCFAWIMGRWIKKDESKPTQEKRTSQHKEKFQQRCESADGFYSLQNKHCSKLCELTSTNCVIFKSFSHWER